MVTALDGSPMFPHRRIGGSDISKLLGISKYGNEADVYLRVMEGIEDEWTPRMRRGEKYEPVLRATAQKMFDLVLSERASDYHAHPDYEFAGAQVDDVAVYKGARVAVDYKSQSRWAKGWGSPGSEAIPPAIHAQIAWEMACTDLDLGLLVVGFGEDVGEDFILANIIPYEIPRDPVFECALLATANEFWERYVLPRTPPDVKPMGKKKAKAESKGASAI